MKKVVVVAGARQLDGSSLTSSIFNLECGSSLERWVQVSMKQ